MHVAMEHYNYAQLLLKMHFNIILEANSLRFQTSEWLYNKPS